MNWEYEGGLIELEGVDKSGKTTLSRMLGHITSYAAWFADRGPAGKWPHYIYNCEDVLGREIAPWEKMIRAIRGARYVVIYLKVNAFKAQQREIEVDEQPHQNDYFKYIDYLYEIYFRKLGLEGVTVLRVDTDAYRDAGETAINILKFLNYPDIDGAIQKLKEVK